MMSPEVSNQHDFGQWRLVVTAGTIITPDDNKVLKCGNRQQYLAGSDTGAVYLILPGMHLVRTDGYYSAVRDPSILYPELLLVAHWQHHFWHRFTARPLSSTTGRILIVVGYPLAIPPRHDLPHVATGGPWVRGLRSNES